MEFIELYQSISTSWGYINFMKVGTGTEAYPIVNWQMLVVSVCVAAAIWLALFILQGIGIYTIAKNSNEARPYLAFVPFVNLYYLGKILGGCSFFGKRFKQAGLAAMVAQIASFLVGVMYIVSEVCLYNIVGAPTLVEGQLVWTRTEGAIAFYRMYRGATYAMSFANFLSEILIFLLFMELFRCCQVSHNMLLAILVLFVPLSRFIIAFVIRKKEKLSYEEIQQRQAEEFRRHFQMYGGQPQSPDFTQQGDTSADSESGEPKQPNPPSEEPFSEFGKGPFDDV